ncbi:non-specific lipid transfer protein GPI-anchored 19-like isoform X2 [Triticum aestivum]|uniref:non-specific lipid transfer protein GPI-anchored 19-like isoform X2 n=1 Tax=Triticum aestivum TaxID=4565 RepID=UPI001D02159F|nr:non-specific lipid transfer protein GPI-anchored 19-like isoform X2 [Triticum aestivum]
MHTYTSIAIYKRATRRSIDMASSTRFAPLLLLALAALAAAALAPSASAAAAGTEYCRDTLGGLLACHAFMYEGAPAASPACCDAYSAAFNADPFCLCYIANGVYGRSTGYDVNVTHALEIPTSCGQVQPPIQLCDMQGVVLPPYEPDQSGPMASSPAAQPPSGSAEPPRSAPAAPSWTSPPPPPPPPTTTSGSDQSSAQMALVLFTVAAGMVAAVA